MIRMRKLRVVAPGPGTCGCGGTTTLSFTGRRTTNSMEGSARLVPIERRWNPPLRNNQSEGWAGRKRVAALHARSYRSCLPAPTTPNPQSRPTFPCAGGEGGCYGPRQQEIPIRTQPFPPGLIDAVQAAARSPASAAVKREALRKTLSATVALLHRRHAHLIGDDKIDDYVALRWLEWNGGTLRLTATGQTVCDQMLKTR
jgi:hypothetical protein